ncbi:hypothetical protein FHS61_002439 [Altererythrobacter atlanticus]|uniref:Uncharacterized protein n=1 Tax=Croceibacterium atlanticum TaxID=1267766 RepID=A0A0F7KNE1_9SPHN|nr:DUF1285 domain-containing protein [Croceibacterium atlanticum]AKH42028.1 hypothetical protein WYH_00980 [Croceibacterium atlanticum]MBB5733404.1 hypothetical protein [Croceibacterium atlanticum]
MPYDAPSDLASLSLLEIAEAVEQRRLPPVEQWNPAETADSHMRIAADGTWFHEGRPIARKAMVRAFASLLTRDGDGRYWLVTPQCRQSIEVEDAAFIATDMQVKDGALAFRLNIDELVLAGPDHPLRAAGTPDTPAIYLSVRRGCEARLDRSTWLQLAEHALAGEGDDPAVTSQGARFSLLPA